MEWNESLNNNNIYIKQVLINRLDSLKTIHEKNNLTYPITIMILGFKQLRCSSKEELKGRMNELKDILGVD